MATEAQFNQEDDDNKNGQSSGSSDTPLVSNIDSGASSTPNAAPNAPRPTTPSGRPNIQQYLQANQGDQTKGILSAGQQLSNGIQNNAQKQANQVSQGVNQARQGFNASTDPLAQNLGDNATNKIQTAFQDPSKLLQQQDQLDEFKKLRDQGYNTDIQNAGNQFNTNQQALQTQAGQLGTAAQNANTETGRFQLLQNSFGQPNYSNGQQRLDQLFLQAQPGAARGLQQGLQGINNQVGQQVSGLNTEAQAKLNTLQNLSTQNAQAISNGISSNEGDIANQNQQEMANAQAAVAQVPGLRDRLTNNTLTDADIQSLGLTSGQSLYDVDLSKYLNNGSSSNDTPTFNNTNVATPEEVARYGALQTLSGDQSGNSIFDPSIQAGSFKPYDFNSTGLTSDLNTAQNHYEKEVPTQLIQQILKDIPNSRGGSTSAYIQQLNNMFSSILNGNSGKSGDLSAALQSTLNNVGSVNGQNDPVEAAHLAGITDFNNYYKNLQNMRNKKIGSNGNEGYSK